MVDLGSSGVAVSYCYVACLKLKPDSQVEINIALLNGVDHKLRVVFFDVPIEVRNSLVSLHELIADFLFVEVLLGVN